LPLPHLSEKIPPFFQSGKFDNKPVAFYVAFEVYWCARSDKIPDFYSQVIFQSAGYTDYILPFSYISLFVLKAAVASIKMGLQISLAICSHEKINVLFREFIGIEMNPAVIHFTEREFHHITTGDHYGMLGSLPAAAAGRQSE
jgi:hypothetical protein